MHVTVAGTVIDSIDLHGALRIDAPNVTVKRSILRGTTAAGWNIAVYAGGPLVKNLVIQDVEISPTVRSMYTNGVYGHDFTLRRVNIHDVVDSAHVFDGNNVLIENSFLHNNTHFSSAIDKGNADGSHDDSVQVQNGSNITIRNSFLIGSHNAGVQITQGTGVVSNVTIQNNWIGGGGCTLNIAEGNYGTIRGLSISGNVIGSSIYNCPILLTAATKAISKISDNGRTAGGAVALTCRAPSGNRRC